MTKTLNFDKFIREKNNETIDVIVLGSTYKVKAQIPAIVPVMMARAENADDNQLATKMVMKAADAMFGSSSVDKMCEAGMSASDLAELVQQVFRIIQGDETEEEEKQELSDEDSRKATNPGRGSKK